MADMTYVNALLREREGYVRDHRKSHKIAAVDDELALQGFGVDSSGKLVELAKTTGKKVSAAEPKVTNSGQRERAVLKAPETAVPKD